MQENIEVSDFKHNSPKIYNTHAVSSPTLRWSHNSFLPKRSTSLNKQQNSFYLNSTGHTSTPLNFVFMGIKSISTSITRTYKCRQHNPSEIKTNLTTTHTPFGVGGSAVGWSTALQAGRSRVRFPMVSLEFFIDIILTVAIWPWVWLSL
jgi:hypothetical protein